MTIARALAALLLLVALAGCGAMRHKEQAEQAVARFHRQLDDGRFQELYGASGPELRQTTSAGEFTRLLEAVRDGLGAVRSTREQGWHVNFTTGGTIVTLTYETGFARGSATEQFVYRMEGERPVLVGYHINSNALSPSAPPADANGSTG